MKRWWLGRWQAWSPSTTRIETSAGGTALAHEIEQLQRADWNS